jgi:hypothetical protein
MSTPSTPSTPASPPLTVRPWARVGHSARRLPVRARAGGVALLRLVRRLLARVLWLLRGWAGLLAGLLAALAIWLGPAARAGSPSRPRLSTGASSRR